MRCSCCNKVLSDYESSIKSKTTGEYLDTCTKCLSGLQIEYYGNYDLSKSSDEDWENDPDFDCTLEFDYDCEEGEDQ